MSESSPLHVDRSLALSFGAHADSYEKHRPDFPDNLMDAVAALGHRVVDVGSGTGKAAAALMARGCDVVAVEPDSDMADIARAKGVVVEPGTFEEWDPRGRTFDLVVFARSWHWVDPSVALPKLREIVPTGGHVALLAHENSWHLFDRPEVRDAISDVITRDDNRDRRLTDQTTEMFTAAGFEVRLEEFPTSETVSASQWLDTVFTYSKFLKLDAETARKTRARLADAIGPGPLTVARSPRAMVVRKVGEA